VGEGGRILQFFDRYDTTLWEFPLENLCTRIMSCGWRRTICQMSCKISEIWEHPAIWTACVSDCISDTTWMCTGPRNWQHVPGKIRTLWWRNEGGYLHSQCNRRCPSRPGITDNWLFATPLSFFSLFIPGSKWEKISAGMVALPSFPLSPQASVILATDRCKHQWPVA